MKVFAVKEKRFAPAIVRRRPYVHAPFGPVQRVQQARIGRIIRATGAQARLAIGQPNDKYEQEADRVADQVMAMPAQGLQRQPENEEEEETLRTKSLADQITPLVQRQEESPEEEEEPLQAKFWYGETLQRMCPECKEELRAKGQSGRTPNIETNINSMKSGGQPLDPATRSFFEPRFGRDFSDVRVHTDSTAAATARSIHARAFTLGNHVVMGSGEFQPTEQSSQRLLGHELTHVVQQNSDQRRLTPSVKSLGTPPNQGKVSGRTLIQRDLATPPLAPPAPAQATLTAIQIRAAIRYNKSRYNVVGTRLIQDLVGTTPTGTWVDADIQAIAAIQEEYRLKKDGKVGTRTFRFIDNEVRNERLRRTDANCLTSLFINRRAQNVVPRANGATMTRRFTMHAQFPRYCRCRDFEYRQFIRGHFRIRRGRVVHDLGNWFADLPAGRLNAAWQEDGDTTAAALNYGHRTQPDEPINRYINDAGVLDMANGCRYEGDDTPGGNFTGWGGFVPTTGDVFDINVNFRGEIHRRGRVVRSKRWSALRRRFRLP